MQKQPFRASTAASAEIPVHIEDDLSELVQVIDETRRDLSLPAAVRAAGGVEAWNFKHAELRQMLGMLRGMCRANNVEDVLEEVKTVMSLGHNLWAYVYMRFLYNRNMDLYYATLLAKPSLLLPVVYTPTVGEACQKFGRLPFYSRGCYISVAHSGRFREILEEYAAAHLTKGDDGKYQCDCIVFSDGGRILGLGDLGAWGMGIPIGKLDLYTVCAGVDPRRTVPVIIDAGCYDFNGNTDKLLIRDDEMYTGRRENRLTHVSEGGIAVNSSYYGPDSAIREFMQAAVQVFGKHCLLQFEDFNSNDAFPLLAEYRREFLTYNDDIQGTAAVTVAGLLGAVRLRTPDVQNLVSEMQKQTFLFHGAGSANIGALSLLANEAAVPRSQLFVTNSRGLVWRSADGKEGSHRNGEQKEFAVVGKPDFDTKDLVACIERLKPTCIIGAVGVQPGCFDRKVVDAMVRVNAPQRPVIFALSNPKTQAEITAKDAYTWSEGAVIYGSGTAFLPVPVNGQVHEPGQVNNVYVFPGTSFGAVACKARCIPERAFMAAAEAVAATLDGKDFLADRVVPHPDRIRDVGLNVATSVVLCLQEAGLADVHLGETEAEVQAALRQKMWSPDTSSFHRMSRM
jgi:malate dehydrogenase (oxaloacetate-decarboxylating)(NADP+)